MKRKIISCLVTLAMCLSLFPVGALAVDTDISGTGLTIDGAAEAESKSGNYTAGSGTVTVAYDADTQTVTFTLTDATLNGPLRVKGTELNMVVDLNGTNSITNYTDSTAGVAAVEGGNLTVKGSGRLAASNGGNGSMYAFFSSGMTTITGTNVTLSCTDAAVYASGGIKVTDSTIKAAENAALGNLMRSINGNITIENSTLAADCTYEGIIAGNTYYDENGSLVIDSESDIIVKSSSVTLVSSQSNGFNATGNIIIENGAEISGQCAWPMLYAVNNIQIKGSTVDASKGINGQKSSNGIFLPNGSLTIENGSKVTADGYYCGIIANGVTIEDSEVTAFGETEVGLVTSDTLIIRGDDTVVTVTSNAESRELQDGGFQPFPGIVSWGSIEITGGKITVSAKDAQGMQSFGDLDISGENTEVNISNSSDKDFALEVNGNITIDGGKTTVTSTENEGIYPKGNLELRGGSLSVTSSGHGLYMPESGSHISVSGGELKIVSTGDMNPGILGNTMTISGGTVSVECAGRQELITLWNDSGLTYTGGILLLPGANPESGINVNGTDYFLVTCDPQNGDEAKNVLIGKGAKLTVDPPEKQNYIFDGWYNAPSGGTAWDLDNDTVTTHVTLYAQWSSPNVGVTAVSVEGITGTISGTTVNVALPNGKTLTTDSSKISIIPADERAAVSVPVTDDNGATWTFTVTARDGTTTETYTINVSVPTVPQDYTVSVNASPAGGGAVTGGGTYAGNTSVTVTASARDGYHFVNWTEGGIEASTSASYTFVVTADRGLVAVFERNSTGGNPEPTPPVEEEPRPHRRPVSGGSSAEPGGSSAADTYPPAIEPSGGGGSTTTEPARPRPGDAVTVIPKPDNGYQVGSIAVTDQNGDPVAVTMLSDGTYTFKQPGGTVTIEVNYVPLGGLPEGVWVNPFTDVLESDWFYNAVGFVVQNGLFSGTSATAFSPNMPMTRGMLVTVLYRAAGTPDMEDEIWGYPYADVDANEYYGTAAYWARLKGIASGYSEERFGPSDPVTREQLIVMLWRYAGSPAPVSRTLTAPDAVRVGDYARDAVCWAAENGILSGDSSGRLNPQGAATRAEVAQILRTFLEHQENKF